MKCFASEGTINFYLFSFQQRNSREDSKDIGNFFELFYPHL